MSLSLTLVYCLVFCSCLCLVCSFFFFSSRRRHTRCSRDWSSDVCSSDLGCWASSISSRSCRSRCRSPASWASTASFRPGPSSSGHTPCTAAPPTGYSPRCAGSSEGGTACCGRCAGAAQCWRSSSWPASPRSEEHTSELQSRLHLVCRLLLEKKKQDTRRQI